MKGQKIPTEEINKSTLFTEYNIETTQNENDLSNSKSTILAPFNSTNSINSEDLFFNNDILISRNIIKFNPKLRDIDRNYERNNNGELDNGVYVECEYSNYSENLPEHRMEPNNPKTNDKESKSRSKNGGKTHHLKDSAIKNLNGNNLNMKIIKQISEFGYSKSFIIDSLVKNEMNYATTSYYLLLSS